MMPPLPRHHLDGPPSHHVGQSNGVCKRRSVVATRSLRGVKTIGERIRVAAAHIRWTNTTERITVTDTEARRFAMYRTLRNELGVAVADTLMEHLPPAGWGDFARQSDIVALKTDFEGLRADFGRLRGDFDRLRSDIDVKFETMNKSIVNEINATVTDKLNSQMRWMIGLFATQFLVLAAIAFR